MIVCSCMETESETRDRERRPSKVQGRHRSSTVMCVVMCDAAISDVIQSPSAFPLPNCVYCIG